MPDDASGSRPDTGLRVARERAAPGPVVHGFGPRGFRVESRHYAALLLTPVALYDWAAPPLADLSAEALDPVLADTPEFLLLGTGATIRRPPAAFVTELEALGIGIEIMDSRAAARAWGILRGEGRRIAAALLPVDA